MTFHSWFGVYGENENTQQWANERGLRYARDGRCLHWLSTGRCRAALCREGHGSRPWMDHVTGWIDSDGQRLLLCQPYVLGADGLRSLITTADSFNLELRLDGSGWYGHGTIAIELTTKGDQP
jgi:hypothetical protein